MRLFLIRHGETVHNVAGVYAGITDSALTNHGVLQAGRLGAHLAATDVKVSHIFSSDLQRAANTAEAIRVAQSPTLQPVVQLHLLREQDFGFYEGKTFSQRPRDPSGRDAHLDVHRNDPGFRDVESKESMMVRADTFVAGHLLPLLAVVRDEHSIVVVAHGIILNYLWRSILRRFPAANVAVATSADRGVSLDYLGAWSNTGVLDLEVKLRPGVIPVQENATYEPPLEVPLPTFSSAEAGPSTLSHQSTAVQSSATSSASIFRPMLPHMLLVVKAVNSLEHLNGLKKTRGGIGSLKHDPSQKTMDSFFKKRTD
ncbi:putative phosphatase [Lachnellula occidentalis]|uniref:Putative phosphatase n=1 Tax=Lachnellula occidentalis TaxID=215460 RepID=A0A8H8RPZ8_9HELO|nr:putative phosphatase [Lachnellula occidentalis]